MAEGRTTFSFAPAAVAQSSAEAQGGMRPIQMQGGNTSIAGGVAAASQFTEAGPVAGQIGGFLSNLLQPAIDRKKQQNYVKGMVDQMSAVAGEEIRVNNKNPLNTIFGPSAYEEGAVFYAARDATNKWQSNMMADKDNLKRLPPDELTKVIAKSFETMNTGDKFTDMAVNTALIEASQPVIGAIAKERYKWQQGEALTSWSNATNSGGSGFQSLMTSLAGNAAPNEQSNIAANAAHNNFLGSLQQPAGMDEETYRKGLIGFYGAAAERGDGYAITALKSSGFLNLLTDEERTKLEDKELKYGNRALSAAAVQFAPALDRLNFNMEFGKVSATEAMATLADINEKVKGATGFDQDLFDYKDIVGAGKNVWTAMHAQMQRQEDRKWQIEDRAAREKFEMERDAKKAHDEAAQIQTAYAAGRVKTAMAAGIGATGNFDILAQADYASGNWSNMVRSYDNDQWVSNLVKDQVQAQVGGSMGGEYNKDFELGYKKFEALNAAKPAAAMAYYGDLYAPLLDYKRLVTSGVAPGTAFARSFANPEKYAPVPDLTKKANEAIDNYIAKNRGNTWGGFTGLGRDDLTASGTNALKSAMSRQLGVNMKNSDMGPEALIPNMYQELIRSGAFEDYGRLGWSNKPGTPNLGKQLGLQQDEADEVVQKVIDKRLKDTGFKDGVRGDNFDIRRIKDANGNALVAVTPYDDEDGAGTTALIPFAMFKQEADSIRSSRIARGSAPRGNFGDTSKIDAARRRAFTPPKR